MEELWQGRKDLLNRKGEAEFLFNYLKKRYIVNKNKPFVLNINAEWGFGKTFFLENLAEDLREKHPVFYFDAWQNDYTKEPLLAFISEIDRLLTPYFNKNENLKKSFKEVINSSKGLILPIIIKKLTGHSLEEIEGKMETPEGEKQEVEENKELKNEISSIISKAATLALTEHQTIKGSIHKFKVNMKNLLHSIEDNERMNLPMFVFIDELDRCRPDYAIELLENIKHIFDIPGIIFIVATDSKQLSHSINAVYGNNFASERYLKRFFDQEYVLKKPNSYHFSNYLFEINGLLKDNKCYSPLEEQLYPNINLNAMIFSQYSDYFQLSYRDKEQVIVILAGIVLTWNNEKSIHLGYLLFLIMLKQKNNELFEQYYTLDDNKKEDFFNSNIINLHTLELEKKLSFKTFTNRSQTEYPISDLIKFYLKIHSKDLEGIVRVKINSSIYESIIYKIRKELPHNYATRDGSPRYNFRIYEKLVLHLGQFS